MRQKKRKAKRPAPTSIRLTETAETFVHELESRTGFTASRVVNLLIEIAADAVGDDDTRVKLWRKYLDGLEKKQTMLAKVAEKLAAPNKQIRDASKALKGPNGDRVNLADLREPEEKS